MPLYQFTCCTQSGGCGEKGMFDHAITASEQGWSSVHIVAKGRNLNIVRCPNCQPDWLRKAVADGSAGARNAASTKKSHG